MLKDSHMAKVAPLFDLLNEKLQSFGVVHEYLSTDKSMVPNFGWHSCKQFIRPDQLDCLFCGPICMVFFSNWNKNITKIDTRKSLLEAKIWFMLSFRNSRRNVRCFYIHHSWLTKSTFSHMVTCVAWCSPHVTSKWYRILDFIYIYETFLGLLYTLHYTQLHLLCVWNIIYKLIYMFSLTYENKNTILLRNSRKM